MELWGASSTGLPELLGEKGGRIELLGLEKHGGHGSEFREPPGELWAPRLAVLG